MANLLSTTVNGSLLALNNGVTNAYTTASNGRLYLGSSAQNDYSIYTHMENFGGNYTKLTLDWHTGIKIGASQAYGGIRFYSDAINNGGVRLFSVGEGDANVRVTNNLYIGSSGGWITDLLAGKSNTGHTHDLMRYSLRAPDNVDSMTSSNFRTQMFGSASNGWNLSTGRWNTVPSGLSGMSSYGTLFAWSGSDTHGFIAADYSTANVQVGGGYGDNITWKATLIHSGNIASQSVSYAVTSGTSSATTQTNFAELSIGGLGVATREYVTSQGYLTSLPSHNHDDRYYTESESDGRFLQGTTNPGTPGNFTLSIGNNGTYSYVQSHSSQPLRLNPLGNSLEGPSGSTIWHSGNDGASSGLDADLLDGLDSTNFMRSYGMLNNTDVYVNFRVMQNSNSSSLNDGMYIGYNNSNSGITRIFGGGATSGGLIVGGAGVNDVSIAGHTVWNSSNAPRANFGNLMYYQGFELDANTMATNSTGFTYANNAPFYGPIARFSTGGGYDLWIGGAYSGGGNAFYLRTRNGDAGTFNAWREIITSGNIGSQSVNYASSAGNSATTSQIVFSDLKTNFPSGAGGGHSFASSHYSMGLDSGNGGWDHPHYRDIIIGYHTGVRIGAHYSGIRFYDNSPTTDANNDGNGDGGEKLLMTIGGYVGTANHTDVVVNNNLFANVSMRAPIFYDSNDTGYYLDPNGTSNLSRLLVPNASSGASLIVGNNNTSRIIDDNARKGLVVNADYYPHIYVNALSSASNDVHGAVISMTGVLSAGGYRRWGMGIANTDPSALSWGWWDNESNPHYSVGGTLGYTNTGSRMWLDTGGNLQTTGSMRAQIFYDSQNTAYYVDPNGTSQLSTVYAGALYGSDVYTNGGWFRNHSNNNGIYWSGTGWHLMPENGADFRFHSGSNSESAIRMETNGTTRGYVYADSGNNIGFLNQNRTWRLRVQSDGGVESFGDFRAPIFYDSNDTAFYVDPNSSSRVRNLYVGDSGSNWVDTGGWGTQFHVSNGPHSILKVFARNEGIETGLFSHVGGQSKVGSFSNHDFSVVRNWNDRMTFYSGYTYANGYLQAADSLRAPIFYDSADTTYFLDPNADFAMRVYGEICNSNYAEGKMQPGALNIGRTDLNYAWEGGSWAGDVRVGILANTSETWEIAVHDSGDSVKSLIHFDGGSTITMGRDIGWSTCVVNSPSGYVSNGNPWGTANSAFFPNGITTAGSSNWIYGTTTYIGNAPSNGAGHEFSSSGTQYSTGSITTPLFLVNGHSDNTKGYRIHNTSGSSVSAMFTNSSNQLVIAAGAVDQINLNKKVYVNAVALGVNIAPSATAGRIDASNDIVAYSSSDERLKHNIAPIENALDKVKSLTGVEFDWKPEYKHAHGYEGHDTGIIAQQVQDVMPTAVRTNDTGYLAVRYEKLIGLLIEANKELSARVDELEKKLG